MKCKGLSWNILIETSLNRIADKRPFGQYLAVPSVVIIFIKKHLIKNERIKR